MINKIFNIRCVRCGRGEKKENHGGYTKGTDNIYRNLRALCGLFFTVHIELIEIRSDCSAVVAPVARKKGNHGGHGGYTEGTEDFIENFVAFVPSLRSLWLNFDVILWNGLG